jgi:hypothetical protein
MTLLPIVITTKVKLQNLKAQIYRKRYILRMKSLTRKDCTVAMGEWQID